MSRRQTPGPEPLSVLRIHHLTHSLRTLLAVMSGCVDSIHTRVPRGEIDDELEQIDRVLQDAFDVCSTLVATPLPARPERQLHELDEVLLRAISLVKGTLDDRIALRVRLGTAGCLIAADALQLELILLNVLMDARDAMPAGGVLSLETDPVVPADPASVDRPVTLARISIGDTGSLSSTSRRAVYDGGDDGDLITAIIGGAVRLLGGTILVRPMETGGTQVQLELPLVARR